MGIRLLIDEIVNGISNSMISNDPYILADEQRCESNCYVIDVQQEVLDWLHTQDALLWVYSNENGFLPSRYTRVIINKKLFTFLIVKWS